MDEKGEETIEVMSSSVLHCLCQVSNRNLDEVVVKFNENYPNLLPVSLMCHLEEVLSRSAGPRKKSPVLTLHLPKFLVEYTKKQT